MSADRVAVIAAGLDDGPSKALMSARLDNAGDLILPAYTRLGLWRLTAAMHGMGLVNRHGRLTKLGLAVCAHLLKQDQPHDD